jgi:hypothetical protein
MQSMEMGPGIASSPPMAQCQLPNDPGFGLALLAEAHLIRRFERVRGEEEVANGTDLVIAPVDQHKIRRLFCRTGLEYQPSTQPKKKRHSVFSGSVRSSARKRIAET